MLFKRLCFFAVFFYINHIDLRADPTANSVTINKSETLFFQGEYEQSEMIVNSMLIDLENFSEEEKVKLFVLKSRLAFAFGRDQLIEKWLMKVYEVNRTWKPNPAIDSPKSIEIWLKILDEATVQKSADNPQENNESVDGVKKPNVANSENSNVADGFTIQSLDQKLKSKTHFLFSLMPVGVGHFHNEKYEDGVYYASLHVLFLFLSSNRVGTDEIIDSRYKMDNLILRSTGILGIWGYELEHLMPELYKNDYDKAQVTDYFLSFFPFGVGQKRNNQVLKAYVIGAGQMAGLAMFIHSEVESQRNLGRMIMLTTYAFGVYDAWYHHKWGRFQRPENENRNASSIDYQPLFTYLPESQSMGLGLQLQYNFN
ncbi:MAG: hypothetical protein KBD78_11685 [Oligoflexales bacterium]|nr:hypothetical protein [Oligoflexales bacterium]